MIITTNARPIRPGPSTHIGGLCATLPWKLPQLFPNIALQQAAGEQEKQGMTTIKSGHRYAAYHTIHLKVQSMPSLEP